MGIDRACAYIIIYMYVHGVRKRRVDVCDVLFMTQTVLMDIQYKLYLS